MKEEATIQRGDKQFYLRDGSESELNIYINCRDGVIYKRTYYDCSGYGRKRNVYLCEDTKHEAVALIIHSFEDDQKETGIREEGLHFDSDSWSEIEKLIKYDAELYRTY